MKCDLKAFINVHIGHTKTETEQQSVDEVYVKVTIILITDKKKLLPDPPRME